mgnify:CR=1 FL=1
MRTVAKVLVVALLALAGLILAPAAPSHACTCMPQTPQDVMANHPAVVVGVPIEVTPQGGQNAVTFEVHHSYKTRLPAQITVMTAKDAAACGVYFELGVEQTVVLDGLAEPHPPKDTWHADSCANLNSAELIQHAGESLTPTAAPGDEASSMSTVTAAGIGIGALAVLAGLIGWWYSGLRRR